MLRKGRAMIAPLYIGNLLPVNWGDMNHRFMQMLSIKWIEFCMKRMCSCWDRKSVLSFIIWNVLPNPKYITSIMSSELRTPYLRYRLHIQNAKNAL
jgi:hypothetical protein